MSYLSGRRRWFWLIVAAVLISGLIFVLLPFMNGGSLREKFDQTRDGMQLAEVVAILGTPTKQETVGPLLNSYWDGGSAYINIGTDSTGRVIYRYYVEINGFNVIQQYWLKVFGQLPPF
jgi:hypothetical protein